MNPLLAYHNLIRNPKTRWWAIAGSIAYLLIPVDIVPEFLFPIGLLDDTALLLMLGAEILGLVFEKRFKGSKNTEIPAKPEDKQEFIDAEVVQNKK